MATYRATTGNDSWIVPEFGDPTGVLIDGLAGTDTLSFDRLPRSRFSIKKDAATGYILIDSVSGASSTYHLKLVNVERLRFSNGSDVVDLTTLFGDTTAPTVTALSPASGSANVTVTANLTVTFSETVVRGSGNITLLDSAGNTVESFAAASSDRLSVSGTRLTIDPTADLAFGKTYSLQIDAGAVKDGAGNTYAGLASYSFTTIKNSTPVAQDASAILQEDSVYTGVLGASDLDNQALSYQVVQQPAHGTLTLGADGNYSYMPAADYAGTDSFSFTASDGELTSSAAVVSLEIRNVIDRFTGTSGDDKLTGTAAADQFVGNAGNDSLNGGGGVDIAIYSGARSAYQINAAAGSWTVANAGGTEGTDTVVSIERLQFSDGNIAIDMEASAGRVAKLLGAIFGKAAIANQVYAGIGLRYFDSGFSYEQLTKLAYNVAIGANHSTAQLVELIAKNVYSSVWTEADKAGYLAQLDNGTLTQEAFVIMAAESSNNAANIDLVGLNQHGLSYQP